jgi:hypothetical protein
MLHGARVDRSRAPVATSRDNTVPYRFSPEPKKYIPAISFISGLFYYNHPIVFSCSISKSMAKRTNRAPMMNIRSDRAARITKISVSLISLR